MSKRRTSFVTNSSSSSFICEVCGNVESGMDLSASDCGFASCENGHEFCEHHMLSPEVTVDMLKKELQEAIDTNLRWSKEETGRYAERYKDRAKEYQETLTNVNQMEPEEIREEYLKFFDDGVPEAFCPICSLDTVRDADILMYIAKKTGVKTTEVEREIQQQFGTLDELKKYLKED